MIEDRRGGGREGGRFVPKTCKRDDIKNSTHERKKESDRDRKEVEKVRRKKQQSLLNLSLRNPGFTVST